MVVSNTDVWKAFERWSEIAFLAAGGVWITDTALYVPKLVSDISIPGAVNGTLILTAILLTLVGAFGLYVPLTKRAPRLTLTGVLLAAVAGLVTLVTLVWVVSAGFLDQPMPPGSALALIVTGSLLALFLFGVASVRTDAPSRRIGILLLTLAVAWCVWVVTGLLIATPEWTAIVFGVGFSLITSALGYVRHVGATPHDQKARSRLTTTR